MHQINLEFQVGEEVLDDLTARATKILGVRYDNGAFDPEDNRSSYHCIGYRVASSWLDGLRHPWELTKLPEDQTKRNEFLRKLKEKYPRSPDDE